MDCYNTHILFFSPLKGYVEHASIRTTLFTSDTQLSSIAPVTDRRMASRDHDHSAVETTREGVEIVSRKSPDLPAEMPPVPDDVTSSPGKDDSGVEIGL